MSLVIPIPIGYGWVVVSGVASIGGSLYLAHLVSRARRKFGVENPHMYDNTKPLFNCAQRGFQSMLETHYSTLWLMSLSGLRYPYTAAAMGAVWTVGRIVYAYGYATGEPKKRYNGMFLIAPAYFVLMGLATSVGLQILGYID